MQREVGPVWCVEEVKNILKLKNEKSKSSKHEVYTHNI